MQLKTFFLNTFYLILVVPEILTTLLRLTSFTHRKEMEFSAQDINASCHFILQITYSKINKFGALPVIAFTHKSRHSYTTEKEP